MCLTGVTPHSLLQDISNFRGTLRELETLNEAGRDKLAALRRCIDRMDVLARDEPDHKLTEEAEKNREQYTR